MKKTVCFLLIIIIFSSVALADDKEIVAVSDPWPPYVNPMHPNDGLSMEIVRASYKTQGYTVKLEYVPWVRAEKGVMEGKYDILPNTWMTEERKKKLHFSAPYVVNVVRFIKRKDDPFEYDGLSSLNGKIVGTVRGYGYGDDFLKADNFRREEADSFILNIKKLTHPSKRIDLTLEDEIVARANIVNNDPTLLDEIAFTKKALTLRNLYVCCGFKNPRHDELINAFNKGLIEIKANGVYEAIKTNYGIR